MSELRWLNWLGLCSDCVMDFWETQPTPLKFSSVLKRAESLEKFHKSQTFKLFFKIVWYFAWGVGENLGSEWWESGPNSNSSVNAATPTSCSISAVPQGESSKPHNGDSQACTGYFASTVSRDSAWFWIHIQPSCPAFSPTHLLSWWTPPLLRTLPFLWMVCGSCWVQWNVLQACPDGIFVRCSTNELRVTVPSTGQGDKAQS